MRAFFQRLNSSIDIGKEDNDVRLGTAILSHLNHWNSIQLPQVYQGLPISFHHNQKNRAFSREEPSIMALKVFCDGEGFVAFLWGCPWVVCKDRHIRTPPFFPGFLPPKYINVVDLVHGCPWLFLYTGAYLAYEPLSNHCSLTSGTIQAWKINKFLDLEARHGSFRQWCLRLVNRMEHIVLTCISFYPLVN